MINWEPKKGDDFMAVIGDYTLRVEQMNRGIWWWRVYYKDDEVADACDDPRYGRSQKDAKALAEAAYLKHINNNK